MLNPPAEQQIHDVLEKNYMPYAMSVIISRAIPEIDGFKPSHRKLLYTMYKMGLITGNRTKSSNVVGATMKLNPHGDMAIYETMVRLTTANEALLCPFIDSKGNFGKQYSRDTSFAAPRYTEVKLAEVCNLLFGDIEKDTAKMVDNFDGTMKEPTLLPVAFPNILANPNQGIAVGMASNICSFNLAELCDATIAFIKSRSADLSEFMKAPDFSTGGMIIYKKAEMDAIYESGRGSFRVRAKYKFDKAEHCIEVTEIPYTTTAEAIIDKLVELIKAGKIKEITDVRDETDLSGLKLTIDIKRGTDPDKLMQKLYKMTPLEDPFSCNFNILIDGAPRVMGVKEILGEWLKFRMECISRRLRFDISKKEERLHLLLGLREILLDIDKAVRIIRGTEDDSMVVPNIMQGFNIDKVQAEYVADIKLRNLNKQYILKRTEEIETLKEDIEKLRFILESEKEIKKVIISELKEVKEKYGIPRKSEIVEGEEIEDYEENKFIEDYNLRIFFTKENYIKKISLVSLRASSEHKLKEGDEIIGDFEASNKWDVLMFSDKQNVYKMHIYDLPDCKAGAMGEFLPNILGLDEGERIVYTVPTEKYDGLMLFAFQNGKVAKVPMDSYITKLNRKKLTKAYGAASPIAGCVHIKEDEDIVLSASSGKLLVINSKVIPLKTTRSTQGVQTMRLKKGSELSSIALLKDSSITEVECYRTRAIPSGGYYPKGEDSPQMQLF